MQFPIPAASASPTTTTVTSLCALCELLCTQYTSPQEWPHEAVATLAANAMVLAVTQRGCPALIRVYEQGNERQRAALQRPLLPHLPLLAKDSFANYLVQRMFELCGAAAAEEHVQRHLATHLFELSLDKYGSNVVQTVLRVCAASSAVRLTAVSELSYDVNVLHTLTRHPYGNFVVQTLFATATTLVELATLEARARRVMAGCAFATNILAKLTARRAALLRVPLHHVRSAAPRLGRRGTRVVVRGSDCDVPAMALCGLQRSAHAADTAQLYAWAASTCGTTHCALVYRHDPLGAGRLLFCYRRKPAEEWRPPASAPCSPAYADAELCLSSEFAANDDLR